ncbi:hypothetical protein HGRIS_007480 [Hohenbuehelia grisea]|uniref:Uncharacterized protein n=1 Tax=Hohenbuehelia grisea TaxID=104357 RepID=A0ABR3J4Z3_9AGAR
MDLDTLHLRDMDLQSLPEEIHAFCSAIRSERDWHTEVLDESCDLLTKWQSIRSELQLGVLDEEEVNEQVLVAINDLKI